MKSSAATKANVRTIFRAVVFCALAVFISASQAQAAFMPPDLVEELKAKYPEGLPRYMTPEEQAWLDQQAAIETLEATTLAPLAEGGIAPLYVQPPGSTAPPTGPTWTPGEYEPLAGILVRWTTGSYYDTALRGLVAQASQATYVWCFVSGTSEQSAASSAFSAAGANMSNVGFITHSTDSIWIRDYGPRYFYENNGHAVMDHTYNRSGRPLDDGVPSWLAGYWSDPYYGFGLTHGGGNFHCFSDGNSFSSDLILEENSGYSADDINEIMRDYFNTKETLFPKLSSSVDATGHLDMWFLPLGPGKVLISEFSSNTYGQQTTTNNAAAVMAARGYTVYRTPAWNSGSTHYTYTNSVIINGSSKRVIIPQYGGSYTSQDATALSTFQTAMPDYTVVQVNCASIIPLAGAVHCIMKHVYAPTTPVPTIEVTAANGDEWWKVGTQHQVEWIASDDVSVTSVDLYYSTNNGTSFNTIATGLSNTGSYDWTIPSAESTECLIRAIAYDASANSRADVSDAVFTISVNDPPPPPEEPPASGTVTTDTSNSSRTSATFSHTVVDGDNRMLAVSIMFEGDDTVNSVTYAGNALTRAVRNASGGSGGCGVEIWYLVNPPVGTASVVVSFGTSVVPSGITAVNFTGVDQDSPIGATAGAYGNSTNVTTGITTLNTNSLIFGAATSHGGDTDPYTPGSGITELWDTATGTSSYADAGLWGGEREAATAGAYMFNTTSSASDDWAISAVELNAAPASVPPPGQATSPSPSNGETDVDIDTTLSWTAGTDATSHDVYFGTDSTPDAGEFIQNQPGTTYDPPGSLTPGVTYYWRIDEVGTGGTTTGVVWNFTTLALPGQASAPVPSNNATDVSITQDLSWTAGSGADSHDVYFGTVSPPPYQTNQTGTTYDTGTMVNNTTYYWRIDERNDSGVTTGTVWSFTTLALVPDVVGMTEAAADSAITGAGLVVGNVSYQCSDTVAAGLVISQDPTGGTQVNVGSSVDLVVSTGQPVVPDVTGMTEADAITAINGTANISYGTSTTQCSDTVPAGDVISQSATGTVSCGTVVDLVVSTGPCYFTISGTITVAGSGLAGVQMSGLPGDPCTDASGFYTAQVNEGFGATVMPTKAGYTFDPNSRSYTDVTGDQPDQDYKAMPSDDFDDNRRGAMWRLAVDDPAIWVSESAALLNIGSDGWLNLVSSCLGHWTMNDNAGSPLVVDSSDNGNDGTAQQNTSVLHTAGKIDGALTFNGTSDYVNVGVALTGAYTKVAWVKRTTATGNFYNNIISSNTQSHFFWIPYHQGYKLTAGHNYNYYAVQDSVAIPADGNYYFVAVTYDPAVGSGTMVLYKNGVPVDSATSVEAQNPSTTTTYIGRFLTSYYFAGSIDNAMIFDRALTADEISALYNAGNGRETLSDGSHQVSYKANGWSFDTAEDFAVKVDYHYGDVSTADGWMGMSVGDDVNYVSISVGSDNDASYYYYEAAVDGSVVMEQEARTSDDGTLYITYDSAAKSFYLSHTGFGSGNAYIWQASNPTQGQWSVPVDVAVGGGSTGAALSPGEAYLNDFEMQTAELFDWPPVSDVDGNGYIEFDDLMDICENWLDAGPGDIDNSGLVDLYDLAKFGPAW